MIPPKQTQQALRALNHVLVLARKMAYDHVSHSEIADVLDVAEYLPQLVAADDDRSAAFRQNLEGLATRWPDFTSALHYFDAPTQEWPW